jgi:hypothetical protein
VTPGEDLSLVGWRQTETGLRALAVTGRSWLVDRGGLVPYLADPAAGTLDRRDDIDCRLEINSPLSPDAKRRVRMGKDDLIVTDLESDQKRRLVFHPDDRRYVDPDRIQWAGPRHVSFSGRRLALIDVETMKMNYPVIAGGVKLDLRSFRFSPDFRWVLYKGSDREGAGLFLAPVESTERP